MFLLLIIAFTQFVIGAPLGGAAVFVGVMLEALYLDRALDKGPSAQDLVLAVLFRLNTDPETSNSCTPVCCDVLFVMDASC